MKERGSAALELALGIAVLVLPALLATVSFGPWLEARSFVRAASAEAARAAVLAEGDPGTAGVGAALAMAEGRGIDGMRIGMCGASPTEGGGGECELARGGVVTATVSVDVALVSTPWGDIGGVAVTATHVEPVDVYRSLP